MRRTRSAAAARGAVRGRDAQPSRLDAEPIAADAPRVRTTRSRSRALRPATTGSGRSEADSDSAVADQPMAREGAPGAVVASQSSGRERVPAKRTRMGAPRQSQERQVSEEPDGGVSIGVAASSGSFAENSADRRQSALKHSHSDIGGAAAEGQPKRGRYGRVGDPIAAQQAFLANWVRVGSVEAEAFGVVNGVDSRPPKPSARETSARLLESHAAVDGIRACPGDSQRSSLGRSDVSSRRVNAAVRPPARHGQRGVGGARTAGAGAGSSSDTSASARGAGSGGAPLQSTRTFRQPTALPPRGGRTLAFPPPPKPGSSRAGGGRGLRIDTSWLPGVHFVDHEHEDHVLDGIFAHMRDIEPLYAPNPRLIEDQLHINHRMRTILFDWMIEVCQEYLLKRETFYYAANFTDRYLSARKRTPKTGLQLVGLSALFLAAKVEEIYPPHISDFALTAAGAYTVDEIRNMEKSMLQVLRFDLAPATAHSWASSIVYLFGRLRRSDAARVGRIRAPRVLDLASPNRGPSGSREADKSPPAAAAGVRNKARESSERGAHVAGARFADATASHLPDVEPDVDAEADPMSVLSTPTDSASGPGRRLPVHPGALPLPASAASPSRATPQSSSTYGLARGSKALLVDVDDSVYPTDDFSQRLLQKSMTLMDACVVQIWSLRFPPRILAAACLFSVVENDSDYDENAATLMRCIIAEVVLEHDLGILRSVAERGIPRRHSGVAAESASQLVGSRGFGTPLRADYLRKATRPSPSALLEQFTMLSLRIQGMAASVPGPRQHPHLARLSRETPPHDLHCYQTHTAGLLETAQAMQEQFMAADAIEDAESRSRVTTAPEASAR